MNGISSEQIIGERYGHEKVLYSHRPGHGYAMKFWSRPDLSTQNWGTENGVRTPDQADRLKAMTDFLDRAKIAYVAEDDILHRLWGNSC